MNVFDAARQRIEWTFDNFERVYVSFSGGKDSSVMFHMAMDEARKRKRKLGVMFIDLEAQYELTIEHVEECFDLYQDEIEPYWVSLPVLLRNAVSVFEHRWLCWDPEQKDIWVRKPPALAITKEDFFPFFRRGMEFEEFVPKFGEWFGGGKSTACMVGIRTDESLNRWRTIKSTKKTMMDGRGYTTKVSDNVYNVYPIYDWRTRDIWIYNNKERRPYNRLYDRMHQAGLTIHQQRICQPYGDDQRKGLWLFHVIEPQTWAKVVARVNGANQGALYARESGNALGRLKISKPENHTWKSFAYLLLGSMPPAMKRHYEDKMLVFIKWWADRGYPDGIPDVLPANQENASGYDRKPSWRRICKALLRNDYWCKGLSFSQTSSTKDAVKNYRRLMDKRRQEWDLTM